MALVLADRVRETTATNGTGVKKACPSFDANAWLAETGD